ncbi:hypothetical protein RHDC4_00160 [Rhodocyclaceae bacterium]|nr:hypothetical protein RHDC4_00160 [Rhodocyclaceae bacterium]
MQQPDVSEFLTGPVEVHISKHHTGPRFSLSALLEHGAKVVAIGALLAGTMLSGVANAAAPSGGVELKTGGAGIGGNAFGAAAIVNQFHNGALGASKVAFNHAQQVAQQMSGQGATLAQPGGHYVGKVVAMVDGYAIQDVGRGKMVLHKADNLTLHPTVNQSLDVKYLGNGKALTTPQGVGMSLAQGR